MKGETRAENEKRETRNGGWEVAGPRAAMSCCEAPLLMLLKRVCTPCPWRVPMVWNSGLDGNWNPYSQTNHVNTSSAWCGMKVRIVTAATNAVHAAQHDMQSAGANYGSPTWNRRSTTAVLPGCTCVSGTHKWFQTQPQTADGTSACRVAARSWSSALRRSLSTPSVAAAGRLGHQHAVLSALLSSSQQLPPS